MPEICRTNDTSSFTSVTAKNSSIRMLQADMIAQDVMMHLVISASVPVVSFLIKKSIWRYVLSFNPRERQLNHKRKKQRRQHFHSWKGLKTLPYSPREIALTDFLWQMHKEILTCQNLKCMRLPQIKHTPLLHPTFPTIKCQ